MYSDGSGCQARVISFLGLVAFGLSTSAASGQGATRDLSAYTEFNAPFTVTITLYPPPDTGVAGLEDSPPAGWINVENISDSGIYDAENLKVKWGPFVGSEQIPAFVTYDITPPASPGDNCFSGIATYDDGVWPIAGDECISMNIPAVSQWGLGVMTLLVLTAGTLVHMRRGTAQVQRALRPTHPPV